jgi:hypothetical protein
MILSISTIIVLASEPPKLSEWAFITSSQNKEYSDAVVGTYKVFGGKNYSTSSHALTICSQYYDASSADWKFDKKIKVNIDSSLNDTYTTFLSEAVSWRVYLKPYAAWQSGCNGEGYIWYAM